MDPLFGWLLGLLAIAIATLWLVIFPEAREALRLRLGLQATSIARRAHQASRNTANRWAQQAGRLQAGAAGVGRMLRRHWQLSSLLAVILIAPALLVLNLRQHVMLDGYDLSQSADTGTAALVASLLRGEQLAPPPALPPEVFITREVEMLRPGLGLASRNWDKLDADFRQRLLVVFKIMKERYGYELALLEGYRSPERQAMLAAQGSSVTNAGAYQSYHQYGLAADCAFYRDGRLVISEKDPWAMRGYQLYGQVAAAAGLVWGGQWKMLDLGHVELHKARTRPVSD